ncbi:MAG: response regulator [Deltaproteobacteria bacterium]|jgi:CheY-like chemotaxis protein|nr:response regulator [Deltaproteobacteria bacterium]MBW2536148.1 response regulator [Deltaproteobacteria bacterium]
MSSDKKRPIGSILLKQRAVSAAELEEALAKGGGSKVPLATRLTQDGIIEETEALKALSEQSGVPGIDLNQVCIRLKDLELLPRETAESEMVLPVLLKGDRLFVAMAEPDDARAVTELEFATGKKLFPYIALRGTLTRVIGEAYDRLAAGERYYAGPACPPETLRKAGITVDGSPKPPNPPGKSLPKPRPRPPGPPPPKAAGAEEDSLRPAPSGAGADSASAVVLDDAMSQSMSTVPDVDEGAGFAEVDLDSGPAPAKRPRPAGASDGPTVLVVDDEADVRHLLVRVFTERGYHVLEAEDGEIALQAVRSDVPDVLVLDAMLPKVHGFEIARRIKGSDRYGHIPIVMVSAVYRGWRFAEDVKTNYGVEAYLEKPFKVGDVVAAVQSALEAPQGTRQDAESTSEEAERCLALGLAAYKAGDVDGAIEHLRAGTQADPLAYQLRFHLGLLYGKAGQLYDAIQELETVASLRSGFFPALKNLAVLYQNAGFRNKSLEMWERCIAAAPDEETRQSIKRHLMAVL